MSASERLERLVWSALDQNRVTNEQLVLSGINRAIEMEVNDNDRTSRKGERDGSSSVVTLVCRSASGATRVWKQKRSRETRASVKWRMAARLSTDPLQKRRCAGQLCMKWKLLVHRKCDVQGAVEDNAASGQLLVGEGESGSSAHASEPPLMCILFLYRAGDKYALCSAVVYCDADDVLSLWLQCSRVAMTGDDNSNGEDEEEIEDDSNSEAIRTKVFLKDLVVVPHHVRVVHTNHNANIYTEAHAAALHIARRSPHQLQCLALLD